MMLCRAAPRRQHPSPRRRRLTWRGGSSSRRARPRQCSGGGGEEGSVRARWVLDAKFACKLSAVALVQEWVRDVGAPAGLHAGNCRVVTGVIGARESAIEIEVSMHGLSDLEAFFARVDATEHRKWGARAKDSIVDGTSQWFIFNSVPLAFPGTAANTTTQGVTAGVPVMDAADSARPSGLLLADQMPDASSLSALATDALGSKGAGRVARQSLENALGVRAPRQEPPQQQGSGDRIPLVEGAGSPPQAPQAQPDAAAAVPVEEEDAWWREWDYPDGKIPAPKPDPEDNMPRFG